MVGPPDRRLRIYVSSTLPEYSPERDAVARAIADMHLSAVSAPAGSRPHDAHALARRYLEQSDVFIAVYADPPGPAADLSVAHDEFQFSTGMPRLIYVRDTGNNTPALDALLTMVRDSGDVSYRLFTRADELEGLIAEDIAILLTERFADAPQPPQPAPAPPSLPLTTTSFVGRRRELEQVTGLLRDPATRLVTLFGPGGVGKTRLALEAGRAVADEFPDGQVILWLDGLKDPSFLLQALAAELQVKETAESPVLVALGNRLRGHRMLIVLDNFEHLISAAPVLGDVIELPTASKFLVTTRELLHIRGERAVEIDPLPLPAAGNDSGLAQSDAVALFVDRATAAAPTFSLTPANAADVAEIVRRLEGVPLALELAAARVRILPPAALLRRLSTSLDLGHGARDLPERQQTLRATIDWSYQLLDESERRALERLSVFPAAATVEAALDALDTIDGADGLELLESLLRKSLLRRTEDAHGTVGLSLLASVREFAGERLQERGEVAPAKDRHAEYFSRVVADAATHVHSATQGQQLQILDDALEHVAAALDWYASSDQPDQAWGIANNLRWYWVLRGHLSAADRFMARLLDLPGGDDVLRAHAEITAGMIAYQVGDLARARRLFESALVVMNREGDEGGLAWARTGLGATVYGAGDLAEAERLQEQALEAFRSEGDLVGQCTANTRIGTLSLARGEYEAAQDRFTGSLEVRRRIGDPWGTSYVLTGLASLRLLAGDYAQATTFFDEALSLARSINHADGIARVLDGLGVIDAAAQRWGSAAARFNEAARLFSDVGNRASAGLALAHLSRAEIEVDRDSDAAEHAVAAFAIADETGSSEAFAASLDAMACVVTSRGDAGAAATLFGAAGGVRARHRIVVPPNHPLGPARWGTVAADGLEPAGYDDLVAAGAALEPAEVRAAVARVHALLVAAPGEVVTDRR